MTDTHTDIIARLRQRIEPNMSIDANSAIIAELHATFDRINTDRSYDQHDGAVYLWIPTKVRQRILGNVGSLNPRVRVDGDE